MVFLQWTGFHYCEFDVPNSKQDTLVTDMENLIVDEVLDVNFVNIRQAWYPSSQHIS